MLYTRYGQAGSFCQGKDVLEVACGSGQGLGYLAARARRVVGGDYTAGLLWLAQGHYGPRIPLVQLDAHRLPFRDQSFDVVVFYEAIYYLARPDQFLAESRRVLRGQGVVLICSVNKEWSDFNPSPLSARYFSARELGELLEWQGFGVELYGAFPVSARSAREQVVSAIKRLAVRLRLIPRTMRGKAALKRLFFGSLTPIPPEIKDGIAEAHPLVPLSTDSSSLRYKVLYAVARLR